MEYKWQSFDQLNLEELYAILRVRQEVFTVEQAIPYVDNDNRDQQSWHLTHWASALKPAAYLRVVPEGEACRIGRVLTAEAHRGRGLGKAIIKEGIRRIEETFANRSIIMSAQAHLESFYRNLGFSSASEVYIMEDLPHIDMRRE